jgi:peptidyl-prolyl cis-trans isomerase C
MLVQLPWVGGCCYHGLFMKQIPLLVLLSLCSSVACKKAPPAPAATPPAAAGSPSSASAVPAGAPAAPRPMPPQLPNVLARVNGEAIEKWEFDNAVKRVEARAGSPVPADKRDEVFRGLLDQLVAYHLLAQESRARKLDVTDAEVDAHMGQARQGFPTDEAFKQGLAAQGITMDQLRQQARTSLQVQKVIEAEVAPKIAVQEADVSAFYQQNLERFKQGESVHASHILIGAEQTATPAQKADARAKAQAALKQVRAGADFAAVARAQSQDPGSAPSGGDLGFFPKGQMTPAFEAAAFTLKPGAVSGVVETPFGFHIIKVHERRAPRTAPLAEVGGQIKEFLEQGQREAKIEQFVEQVKTKSKVEILV